MTREALPLALGAALAFAPARVLAQVGGLSLEAGPAFLTRAGMLGVGPGAIESERGYALRGVLRLGLGGLSLAGELQTSAQDFPAGAGLSPENLNARYAGVSAAFHPLTVLRVTPYAEFGIGRLFFSDESLARDEGREATLVGLGARLQLSERVGLDAGLRLQRGGRFGLAGLPGRFRYDPKVFAVLLTLKLG